LDRRIGHDFRKLRAARAAGVDIARVEIDRAGNIAIITVPQPRVDVGEDNEWDRV
jgi:hypothetical protein